MSQQQLLKIFEDWFWSLKNQGENEVTPGIIANLLQVVEDLKVKFDLEYRHYITKNGTQIRGIGYSKLHRILASFDEHREFLKEAGRTSRGGPPAVEKMLSFFKSNFAESLDSQLRNETLTLIQFFMVERVRDFHNRQKLKLVFDHNLSTWQIIHNLYQDATKERKAGYLAQHLVGAKLELRFPNMQISNESASTADKPTNRAGDFMIGSTAFHVTVSPMEGLYKKCQMNLREGLKVYLIVPDAKLAAARQLAEEYCNGQLAVESLESFVSQNIEEISIFSADALKENLVSLINIYNKRVDAVEVDKSLMIELPSNLEKYNG